MTWPFVPIWLVLAFSLYLLWKARSALTLSSSFLALFAALATNNRVFSWLWGLDLGFAVLNEYTVLFMMLGATGIAALLDAIALIGLRRAG